MKCSEGLVTVNVGAHPSVLRGEPVSENSREEPVSENSREEPVSLKCSEGLVTVNVGVHLC